MAADAELCEILGELVFASVNGYGDQLAACQKWDLIASLSREITQEMIRAPDRVAATTVACRLAMGMQKISDEAWKDLREYEN